MVSYKSLLALFIPIGLCSAQTPEVPLSQTNLQVHIKPSALYKDGREVSLKRPSLRRVRFAPNPRDRRTPYLKVEVWFTNTDIDACTQPPLGEIADLSMPSDTSFVLVWQGGDFGTNLETLNQTFVGRTLFADAWLESRSMPVVLVWTMSGPEQIRGFFPDEALHLNGVINQSYQDLTLLPKGIKTLPDSLTFVWVMNHSLWTVFHREAKNGREDGVSTSSVKISKGPGFPLVEFFGRSSFVGVSGRPGQIQVCPSVLEEQRHFFYDKPVRRPKP